MLTKPTYGLINYYRDFYLYGGKTIIQEGNINAYFRSCSSVLTDIEVIFSDIFTLITNLIDTDLILAQKYIQTGVGVHSAAQKRHRVIW